MKKQKQYVDITADGTFEFIDTPELSGLAEDGDEVSSKRISRVDPVDFLSRFQFYLVRFFVSDKSGIAEWTRGWRCSWRVRILETGFLFGPYESRAEAIEAEVDFIKRHPELTHGIFSEGSIFHCSVCGSETDTAPDPPQPNYCERCCLDHVYEYDRFERASFCLFCGKKEEPDE